MSKSKRLKFLNPIAGRLLVNMVSATLPGWGCCKNDDFGQFAQDRNILFSYFHWKMLGNFQANNNVKFQALSDHIFSKSNFTTSIPRFLQSVIAASAYS